MSLQKNKIYHRAGISLFSKDGLEIYGRDFYDIGKAMGLSDNDITVGLYQYVGNDTGNITVRKCAFESSYECIVNLLNNFGSESLIESNENIFDGRQLGGSNSSQNNAPANTQPYIYICSYKLSDTNFYYVTFVPWNYSESEKCITMTSLLVSSQSTKCLYRVSDYSHNTSQPHLWGWNCGISDYGGVISNFNLSNGSSISTVNHFQNNTASTDNTLCVHGTNNVHIYTNDYITTFFTRARNINDNQDETPSILTFLNKEKSIENDSGVDNTSNSVPSLANYFITGKSLDIESISPYFFAGAYYQEYSNQLPVLANFSSKISDYYTPYLYIKDSPAETLFGHVQLGDKEFLAGSFCCLEC